MHFLFLAGEIGPVTGSGHNNKATYEEKGLGKNLYEETITEPPGSQNRPIRAKTRSPRRPEQSPQCVLRLTQGLLRPAQSDCAQAFSPSTQAQAAAAHIEKLKQKQCQKILGRSLEVDPDVHSLRLTCRAYIPTRACGR